MTSRLIWCLIAAQLIRLISSSDLPVCPRVQSESEIRSYRPSKTHWPPPKTDPRHPHVPQPPSQQCKNCKEDVRLRRPKITDRVFSPVVLENVVENIVLICKPGSKIKRLEVVNSRLQYNSSCNAVLTGKEGFTENIMSAVIATKDGETSVPLNAGSYEFTSALNMGNEQYVERALLAKGICEGDTFLGYAAYVSEEPTMGCGGDGVRTGRAVFYRVDIRGPKCCTECNLLAADYTYSTPIAN